MPGHQSSATTQHADFDYISWYDSSSEMDWILMKDWDIKKQTLQQQAKHHKWTTALLSQL